MTTKLKITVMKTFGPEEVFGHTMLRDGKAIQACSYKVGEEFIMDSHLDRPKDFCGRAWQDLYTTLMTYYCGGDYDYPEQGVTYQPCGDGIRPVIFKIEKMSE